MDVATALTTRRSTRAFSKRVVSDATIRELIALAGNAPSWSNTQPYRVAFATGHRCDEVRTRYLAAIESEPPAPDVPLLFEYPPALASRRKACGVGLYQTLGIQRDDSEGRAAQWRANFAFFHAPAVLFLFAERALGAHAALDLGCFLQSFLLAATERGLSTCAQAAVASHPGVVREFFDVDSGLDLYCGIALGYEDEEAEVNRYQPVRSPIDALLCRSRETTEE